LIFIDKIKNVFFKKHFLLQKINYIFALQKNNFMITANEQKVSVPRISNNIFTMKMRNKCFYVPKIKNRTNNLNTIEYLQNISKESTKILNNAIEN
jgi:hypothetical protein